MLQYAVALGMGQTTPRPQVETGKNGRPVSKALAGGEIRLTAIRVDAV